MENWSRDRLSIPVGMLLASEVVVGAVVFPFVAESCDCSLSEAIRRN